MFKSLIAFLGSACLTLSACTVWVLAPDSNETGKYVLHKTRDWGDGKEVAVTLKSVTSPDGKYKVLAFSPYMLFNEKGLGMVDTSAPITMDDEIPGLQSINIGTTMNRVAFNCATVQEALAMLEGFTQDGTNPKHDNYMLCDPNEAVIIEMAPKHMAYRKVSKGFAAHTNHYIYPEILFLSKGKLESKIKSATRLLVTQEYLAKHLQEQGVIKLENTLALSRLQDNENFPNMCPFRNSTVCAADYIPDAEYPGILGTIRICPGPPKFTVAIPVPLGLSNVPECLENGDFGKLAYNLKRSVSEPDTILPQFQEMEQRFWKDYLENLAKAKNLLLQNDQEASIALLQSILDKQVAEAYKLMQSLQVAE